MMVMQDINELLDQLTSSLAKIAHSQQEYFTLEEAADYLRCHPVTLRNLHRSKQITYFMLGGERRYRRQDLDTLVEQRLVPAIFKEPTPLLQLRSNKKYRLKK